jgi:hypothetical protein
MSNKTKNVLQDKYVIYDLRKFKDKIRAIIWHIVIDSEGNSTVKSSYGACVDTVSWDSYCTCIGFQMRKKPCNHLKTLFKDDRYKRMCKSMGDQTIVLNDVQLERFVRFLKSREDDIASDWEDFGELKEIFEVVIGREAGG